MLATPSVRTVLIAIHGQWTCQGDAFVSDVCCGTIVTTLGISSEEAGAEQLCMLMQPFLQSRCCSNFIVCRSCQPAPVKAPAALRGKSLKYLLPSQS